MYCYCTYNTPECRVSGGTDTLVLVGIDGGTVTIPRRWAKDFSAINSEMLGTQLQTRCFSGTLDVLMKHLQFVRGERRARDDEYILRQLSRDLEAMRVGQTDVSMLAKCAISLGIKQLASYYTRFWTEVKRWGEPPW